MNKKVTIIAVIFMFFLSTCGAFAQAIPVRVNINLGTNEVAQRHHHRQEAPPPRHQRCHCDIHCKCVKYGNCRPGHCVRNCKCKHHRHEHHRHHNHRR